MTVAKLKQIYFIAARVFFILLFAFVSYVTYEMFWDDYQENYYTNLNIGFTVWDYVLKYPVSLFVPFILLLALPGFILRWRIGWAAAMAFALCTMGGAIVLKEDWNFTFLYQLAIYACLIIMLAQLRTHFDIKPKHWLWVLAVIAVYVALEIIADHGGFLTRRLPA